MRCALCQKTKKLCKSHIISELFYKPLYDSRHRFRAIHSSTAKVSRHQKGFKEPLLCDNCEQKLSTYEKYVGQILLKQYPKILKKRIGDIVHFGIDYKKSRLFYLSILWRMSIATHKYFQKFSIAKYNETLRNLINTNNPGNPNEFGCVVSALLIDGSFKRDWFLDPQLSRLRGDSVCWVVFGGLLYIFFITFNHNPSVITQAFIQKNNSWLIAIDDARRLHFIDRRFRSAQKILNKNP